MSKYKLVNLNTTCLTGHKISLFLSCPFTATPTLVGFLSHFHPLEAFKNQIENAKIEYVMKMEGPLKISLSAEGPPCLKNLKIFEMKK